MVNKQVMIFSSGDSAKIVYATLICSLEMSMIFGAVGDEEMS
jgi:hypothetical protein